MLWCNEGGCEHRLGVFGGRLRTTFVWAEKRDIDNVMFTESREGKRDEMRWG